MYKAVDIGSLSGSLLVALLVIVEIFSKYLSKSQNISKPVRPDLGLENSALVCPLQIIYGGSKRNLIIITIISFTPSIQNMSILVTLKVYR